ncbi:MAG: glycosyltransferase [Treponema sp.]|nr:glycosyltransferase [Treponema sp.]
MPVLELLPFIYGVFYVLLQSAILAGLFMERRRETRGSSFAVEGTGGLPRVSVIVSVHNEESRLPPLLEDLAAQEYGGVQIVLVDDRSTDGTAALLSAFAGSRDNVRVISLQENPCPNHKQYALEQGLAVAEGDFFLFTDADCRIGPSWTRAMVAPMADPCIGVIIGPVFKLWPGKRDGTTARSFASPRGGGSFLYSYQCYDHVVRFVYLAGAVGLGAAGGGFGNNLILRRAALDEAGGYAAVPPSPTEDAALISLIRSATSYQVRSACSRETHVFTKPETTWKSLINQTLRWNNGGLFSPELFTRINYTVLMLTISAAVLSFLLLPFFPKLWPMPLAQFIVMLENTVGALFIARGGALGGIKKTLKAGFSKADLPGDGSPETASSLPSVFWIRELLAMPFYMTLMTLLGFCGVKTTWKDSTIGSRV